MKLQLTFVGLTILVAGCGSAVETKNAPEVDDEAATVRTQDCVFGSSMSHFFEAAEENGFGVDTAVLKYDALTAAQKMQLRTIYDLADNAAVESFLVGKQLIVDTIAELGGPRKFELFRAAQGRMRIQSGTFVLAGTSAVVAKFGNYDEIKSCLVTKLGGLDLRGKACAFGDNVDEWHGSTSIDLGRSSTIKPKSALGALRKAQLLAATEATDLNYVLDQPFEIYEYRTIKVQGLDQKFTYVWYSDNESGAIFRQGSADVVARVGDKDIGQCLVATRGAP